MLVVRPYFFFLSSRFVSFRFVSMKKHHNNTTQLIKSKRNIVWPSHYTIICSSAKMVMAIGVCVCVSDDDDDHWSLMMKKERHLKMYKTIQQVLIFFFHFIVAAVFTVCNRSFRSFVNSAIVAKSNGIFSFLYPIDWSAVVFGDKTNRNTSR